MARQSLRLSDAIDTYPTLIKSPFLMPLRASSTESQKVILAGGASGIVLVLF